MADIFLSYARNDRGLAQRIGDALVAAGFSVWWDDDLDPREAFDREIERELAQARAVLVLWTPHSIESEWVRDEATAAKRFRPKKLIQARFEDCAIPMTFGRVPYVDLTRERPERHPDWAKLLRWLDLARKGETRTPPDIPAPPPPVSTPPPASPPPPTPSPTPHTSNDRRVVASPTDFGRVASLLLLGTVAILFSLLVGLGWFLLLAPATGSVPALLVAPIFVALGLLAARIIGRAVASTSSEHGHGRAPLILYPLLFSVSTFAVFNTAFYLAEGPVILRETIDDAETKLLALAGAATVALRTKRGEATAATVERLLTELDTEITNTPTCGAGPGVKFIIGQIRAILPDFREFGRRPEQCELPALRLVAQAYRAQAYGLLNLDPEERRLAALRSQITGPIATSHTRLHAVRLGLVSSGFTTSYAPSLRAVVDAEEVYATGYDRLAAAKPAAAKPLAPTIDVSRARNLGSAPSLVALLAARLDHLSTWLYFLVAALMDIMLIFLFAENFRRVPPPEPDIGREDEDLQFLWVDRKN